MLAKILHRFVSHPWVYDQVQALAGSRQVHQKLAPLLADTAGKLVLDIGGGTGALMPLLPTAARYVCLDKDPVKLEGLHQNHPRALALSGDAMMLPFADGTVDVVVFVAVAHHLAPQALASALQEMARVCRHRLVFLDALRVPERPLNNLLWHYDRGCFPYTDSELQTALGEWFDIQQIERFAVYHQYMLCNAQSKLRDRFSTTS